jgi:hypothetical protein
MPSVGMVLEVHSSDNRPGEFIGGNSNANPKFTYLAIWELLRWL